MDTLLNCEDTFQSMARAIDFIDSFQSNPTEQAHVKEQLDILCSHLFEPLAYEFLMDDTPKIQTNTSWENGFNIRFTLNGHTPFNVFVRPTFDGGEAEKGTVMDDIDIPLMDKVTKAVNSHFGGDFATKHLAIDQSVVTVKYL